MHQRLPIHQPFPHRAPRAATNAAMRVVDVSPRAMSPSTSSPSTSSTARARARASSRPSARCHRRRHAPPSTSRPRARACALANDVDPEAVQTWQLWFGFFAGLSPVVIAAWEFWKRARIQRGCARCAGSGLVVVGVGDEKRKVKCASCGGFLPFESWSRFFSSDPGNGGRLRAPRGQTRVFYDVDASVEASRRAVDDDEW